MTHSPSLTPSRTLSALALGMSWLPEQGGNGLDRMYYALTQHLPEAGVDVRGLVAGSEDVARSSGGVVSAFASEADALPKRLFALRQRLRAHLDASAPDLVATHFALHTAPALDLLRRFPLVVHFHGPWAGESAAEGEHPLKVRIKNWIEQVVYRRGTRFVVLSEAFRDELMRSYGVSERHIRIVPGGVDTQRFDTGLTRHAARERLGWPADRPVVLSVRRLVRRVGLENLVEAMRHVREQVPDVLLLIAGKGPLESALRARISAAGLGDHARLLGFVPDADLPLAYRAANFSIVPTVALEGFGLIAAESLAAGTPVLVTPVGGLPEVVRGLSGSLVLEDASVKTLGLSAAAALKGDLSLPDADACQAYAQERFAWPVIARQVRDVYAEVA